MNSSLLNLNSIYLLETVGAHVIFLIYLLDRYHVFYKYNSIYSRVADFVEKTVWNGIFVFISETYIVVATVSLIGVQDLRFGN